MNATESRRSIRKGSAWRVVLPPVLVLAALAAVAMYFDEPDYPEVARDGSLCPTEADAITGSTTLLLDFRKPLGISDGARPSELLRNLTLGLERDNELEVFTLNDSEAASRTLLKRLCKPYGNADLLVDAAARPGAGTVRDCDALPAQLTDGLRQNATRFCQQRRALEDRIAALAAASGPRDGGVSNTYLVEAIEDSILAFTGRRPPHTLVLYSDMIQHAPWYSHLDRHWKDWTPEPFNEALQGQHWWSATHQSMAELPSLRIQVFYLPRDRFTDQPAVKEAHQRFWREYFTGADVAFRDQPPMPAYWTQPLPNDPSDADIAAPEGAAAEQLLLPAQQEREEQQELAEQEELEAQRARQAEAERQRELALQRQAEEERRERELAAQRAAEAEAERVRELERQRAAAEERERLAEAERLLELERLQAEREAEARRQPSPVDEDDANVPAAPEQAPPIATGTGEDLPPCNVYGPLRLVRPEYPNRGNLDAGTAAIVVRYTLDEQGETIDNEVQAVPERSNVDFNRWYPVFAREAVRAVRKWSFRFEVPNDGSCDKPLSHETVIRFSLQESRRGGTER